MRMVYCAPDPSKDDEFKALKSQPNPIIELSSESETEDQNDIFAYEGYEPIPVGPDGEMDDIQMNAINQHHFQVDEPNIELPDVIHSDDEAEGAVALPQIASVDSELIKQVWAEAPSRCVDITMDEERVNEVRNAMANFQLPSTNIPSWARNVTEEEWRVMLDRLRITVKRDSAGPSGTESDQT